MPPKKSKDGLAKHGKHSDDSDLSMESDQLSSYLNELSRQSKRSSHKNDATGEKKVRCRYCLKVKSQLRTLKKHVQRHHKDFYEKNKEQRRTYFVAAEG